MGGDAIVRPAYEMSLRSGLAEAANMLAAEAAADQRTIERPFNGLAMKAWPGITGAQIVANWQYDLGCRRDTKQNAKIAAATARAEAAEQRAEAAEAEVARLRADRKALASMWLMTLPPAPLATVLPSDPDAMRLLGGGLIDVTGEDIDTAGLIVYMRDLLARMLAEARPAGEVADV